MYGRRLTAPADPLQAVALDRIYRGIAHPKPPFRDRIEQLRAIAGVDPGRYRELKKGLPYLVCGLFKPGVRRKAHFAAADAFMLDFDHLGEHELGAAGLRDRLARLPEPVLAFISPGGNGLKVLFRLAESCRDEARLQAFYKVFATQFAQQHQLEAVIDYATSDVTRACFMSYDPHAHYRPDAPGIRLADYLPGGDYAAARPELKLAERTIRQAPSTPKKAAGPEKAVLADIRAKLNPKAKAPKRPAPVVPEAVGRAVVYFGERLGEFGLRLVKETPISYGKQLRLAAGADNWCELNLFYGKRGYSIVQTTKSGSNAELAELTAQVLEQLLQERLALDEAASDTEDFQL